MMDLFENLAFGFTSVLFASTFAALLVGVVVGCIAGVLPGISPAAIIALALPVTFALTPQTALVFLTAIAIGTQYGRAATAAGLDPDAAAILRGARAGLIAGLMVAIVVVVAAQPLASVALFFGPQEYIALMVFALGAGALWAAGSLFRGLAMVAIGLILGLVGADLETGAPRLTFGIRQLVDGIGAATLALGLFAFAEVIYCLEQAADRPWIDGPTDLPAPPDADGAAPTVARGLFYGMLVGLLFGSTVRPADAHSPGQPLDAATAASSARMHASFLPLLAAGIPGNAVAALIAAAMLLQGIVPGPQLASKQPEVFWGIAATLLLANVSALVLFAVRSFVKVPYGVVGPAMLALCCLAAYTVNKAVFDVGIVIVAGVLGYGLIKLQCDRGLLLIAFVMAPLLEENFRRSMMLTRGDVGRIFERPFVVVMLAILVLWLGARLWQRRSAQGVS